MAALHFLRIAPSDHHQAPEYIRYIVVDVGINGHELLNLFLFIYPTRCDKHKDWDLGDCKDCFRIREDSQERLANDLHIDTSDWDNQNFADWLKYGLGYELFDVYFDGMEELHV